MLETHLNSPVTRRRLRTGPAADHIDAFADWLHLQGYKPVSIDNLADALSPVGRIGWSPQDSPLKTSFAGFEACKLAAGEGAMCSSPPRT